MIDCDVWVARVPATAGPTLLRRAAAHRLGCGPDDVTVVRRCAVCGGPHGKPAVAGVELSLSHSGDALVVAVTDDAPLGVDVELLRRRPDLARAARWAFAAGELSCASGEADLLRLWTRKEAIVKATGEGLTVPLRDLRVSAPDAPASLLSWAGRPTPPCTLVDLDLPAALVGSLAVLASGPVQVTVRPAPLLAAHPEALR